MVISQSTTQILIEKAKHARAFARVPTSGFQVGAALLAEDGQIYSGCNVEIASVLYAICAERTAIVKAVSEGQQRFLAIAVVADAPVPVSPCGQCRQMLFDFNPEMQVIMSMIEGDRVEICRAGDLLPFAYVRPKNKKD